MPKRKDENETAFSGLQEIIKRDAERDGTPQGAVAESAKVAYRAEAGRKGGVRGGRVRAEKLSKEKRTEIAKEGAKARWSSKKKQPV